VISLFVIDQNACFRLFLASPTFLFQNDDVISHMSARFLSDDYYKFLPLSLQAKEIKESY